MKAVVQWVLRTMMKDQTGIVQTMPKKKLVDFNVAMTAERLMRNGIDPNSLKNANQVENALNMIENRPKVQEGITATKSAKIMDLEGKEIDPRSKIMGGKYAETEAEIKARLEKENKEAAERLKQKKLDDYEDDLPMAQGGIARLGFKDGMTRRTFLKLLGGMAAVPIVGKFFKLAKVGQKVKQVPVIKTDDVAGKPEWFDALVNKVITEGDDVTKKFATGER